MLNWFLDVLRGMVIGLANVAPTVATLLEIPAPDCWEASMI